jgi:hypothetical protein
MPKFFLFLLLAILPWPALLTAPAQKPFVLYAQFQELVTVDLSDGAKWVMDKGDCFPIYMFKEHQTKVVLQIGSSTFEVEAHRVRVMKESESPAALVSYRKNLEEFLKNRSENWKKDAK